MLLFLPFTLKQNQVFNVRSVNCLSKTYVKCSLLDPLRFPLAFNTHIQIQIQKRSLVYPITHNQVESRMLIMAKQVILSGLNVKK
jgi:hypothetical protein